MSLTEEFVARSSISRCKMCALLDTIEDEAMRQDIETALATESVTSAAITHVLRKRKMVDITRSSVVRHRAHHV